MIVVTKEMRKRWHTPRPAMFGHTTKVLMSKDVSKNGVRRTTEELRKAGALAEWRRISACREGQSVWTTNRNQFPFWLEKTLIKKVVMREVLSGYSYNLVGDGGPKAFGGNLCLLDKRNGWDYPDSRNRDVLVYDNSREYAHALSWEVVGPHDWEDHPWEWEWECSDYEHPIVSPQKFYCLVLERSDSYIVAHHLSQRGFVTLAGEPEESELTERKFTPYGESKVNEHSHDPPG